VRSIGLIANTGKPRAVEFVPQVVRAFRECGVEPIFDEPTAALLGETCGVPRTEVPLRCDVLVILGGDGTLLEAVRDFPEPGPAVFGINLGSLGFLTSVGSAAWREAVACVVSGDFRTENRTLLRVDLVRDGAARLAGVALNDAVISRGSLSRLVRLDVSIDGSWLTEYNADGLIVATPTGSTAYSLSAGGPVLTPDCGVFVITPICPHVLTMRSVVVAERSVIEITPQADTPDVFLTIDGHEAIPIARGEVLRVTLAAVHLRLATLPGTRFFDVLRQKLKWSGTAAHDKSPT
jgi:NAD+ kinase